MLKHNFLLILSCTVIISCFSVSAYGDSVEDMHNYAYELMQNKEFTKAVETYSTILELKEYDETALINRAIAFAKTGNYESSLNDFSFILDKNSENLTALQGKAIILSDFECVSYSNCGPLQSLQIFEKMLEIDPENEEIQLKRNLMFKKGLSDNSKFASFDVRKTNGDYIVNVQQIVRDKNGSLVSVIENAGTDISPTLLTEKFLDDRERMTTNFKKEIVRIGENDYIKWHYEMITSDSEEKRTFFGSTKLFGTVQDGEENGRKKFLELNLITSIFPAVNVDVGDITIKITEVFKKI
jgi:tetratricopeptide (TPR) repeat protein